MPLYLHTLIYGIMVRPDSLVEISSNKSIAIMSSVCHFLISIHDVSVTLQGFPSFYIYINVPFILTNMEVVMHSQKFMASVTDIAMCI